MAPRHEPDRRHVLTVGLEDYFHVGSFKQLIHQRAWHRFEPRFEQNTLRALDLLDQHNVKATFFVIGWIADHCPDIVRRVAERGHEIASRGYYHRSIRQMTRSEFTDDLQRAREALERAAGQQIIGHRVAREWFSPADLWVLDVLAAEGYVYDASLGPVCRRFAAEPHRRFVHQHATPGGDIWEFPFSAWSMLGFHLPIAGGNYFRQFPHAILKRLFDHWHRYYDQPFVMYFNVWELDSEQPYIRAAPLLQRISHYRNLGKMSWVLEHYLSQYKFVGVADYLGVPLRQAIVPAGHSSGAAVPRCTAAADLGASPARVRTPVTVVVPCYNEAAVLPYLSRTLDSFRTGMGGAYDIRFLFVDDCSTDETWRILNELFGSMADCTLVRHKRNLGAGTAIITGIRRATTEVVCSIDCDCSYDPAELEQMIPLLVDGVDLVTGSPYHKRGGVRNVPYIRLLMSKAASFLYRRVLPVKLATYTSFLRVHRRSAVVGLPLRETGFLGVAEVLGLLALRGRGIAEHPTTLDVRILGKSKIPKLSTIAGHLRLIGRLLRLRCTSRIEWSYARVPATVMILMRRFWSLVLVPALGA